MLGEATRRGPGMPGVDPRLKGTMVGVIRERALQSPDQPALRFLRDRVDDVEALTRADIDRSARAVAAHLQSMAAVGERVLVLHPPGSAYISALLGCFYAGVIAVPAYPPRHNRSLQRLHEIVLDSQARFALTTQACLDKIGALVASDPALAALSWVATDQVDVSSAESWSVPHLDPGQIAFLQYTSGSTSAPKGVMLTHANLLANMASMCDAAGIGHADHVVTWLPPYHDMGLIGTILTPLCVGIEATLLAPSAFLQRPLRWLVALSRYRGTVSGAPNFAYDLCVRRVTPEQIRALDLTSWRVAFCGAEKVRAETMARFTHAMAPAGLRRQAFTPSYGLAEATLAVSYGSIDSSATIASRDGIDLVSCGGAVPNCRLLVVDPDTLTVQPPGSSGEIWVDAPSVAQGYWGKPGLSREVFAAQPAGATGADAPTYLRTGDMGFVRNGELYVTGRIKDLIVVRGFKHHAEDIEAAVADCHPGLRAGGGAAFAVDHGGEERLVVVHEIDSVRCAPLDEIAARLRSRVAEVFELPVHDVVLLPPGGLPKTTSGKVQRSRCRGLWLRGGLDRILPAAAVPADSCAQPAGLSAQIAALMSDILGMQTVDEFDDFFWLGGHSLMATQLVSGIRNAYRVDLSLRDVFEARTPHGVALKIAAAPRLAMMPPIAAADRRQPLALSFSQERMWYLHQLDPRGSAYNVAGAALLEGRLDVDVLRRAFAAVVARHEILRTNYPAVDGVAEIKVHKSSHIPCDVTDLRGHDDPTAVAMAAASALAALPFDIAADCLLRVALYATEADTHVLTISMHHLVTDAWSLGLLVTDLMAFYDMLLEGRALPTAPDAQLTYVDYAQWQRRHFTDEYLATQLAYWTAQLAGASPVELPTDRPRSQRKTAAGAHLSMPLPDELLTALDALAVANGATLFMLMLAGFEVLLYRYTGHTDLVLGIPVANRNFKAAESLMGSLVNTLALRLRFDADIGFDRLLGQVRETALDAYANQDLPFERLVSALAVERKPGESPLVSIMFDFQNAPMRGRTQREPRMSPLMLSRGAAQFDLSLLVMDTDFGRTAGFEYNSELFDDATIARLAAHYRAILEAVVANPATPIARIPLLSSKERDALLALTNGGAGATCDTVAVAVAAQAALRPQAMAIADVHGTMSYAELDAAAERLTAELYALGAEPGERVAVYLPRDRQLIVALLAVLKTGAAYVPLDPGHPADRVGFVLEDAAPRVLITLGALLAGLPHTGTATPVCLDDADRASLVPASVRAPFYQPQEADAAYIIYTSGSTGRPKGVEVSLGALANFLESMRHTPGLTSSDTVLSVTTVAFDIAGLEIWLPLTGGACVTLVESAVVSDGPRLLNMLQSTRPTLMQATPSTWAMLLDAGWRGDPDLKILCGGEALSPELAAGLLARGGSVWNLYGPTETTVWSTLHRVTSADDATIPIGKPIDRTQVYVLDRYLQLLPQGVPGELTIGGAGVANGYFNRADLTAERFVPDPYSAVNARMYRTGDLGRVRSDGRIECLGRLDNQIKLRGFRIEPGEIEAILKQQARVLDALVVARANAAGHPILVAYIVVADVSRAPAAAELQEQLQRLLPAYMIPVAFMAMSALPKTPNGKIDRKQLPSPDFAAVVGEEYVAPRDEQERAIAEIWSDVLGTPRPGVRDSFFQHGGHSLLAVKLFARIEKRLGVVLPLALLHERPTIEYLAEAARAGGGEPVLDETWSMRTGKFAHLVPIQRHGRRSGLFCVHGAGGNVVNMASISRHLGPDQPFVGLQARGTDGILEPLSSIDAMAAEYLRELRQVQPHGPYYLSGYCGGGVVAFEMANRLRASGEPVALLLLIDCYRPGPIHAQPRLRRWLHDISTGGWGYVRQAAVAKWRRDSAALAAMVQIGMLRKRGVTVPYALRDVWLTRAFLAAAARFRPSVYAGELILLRAAEREPALRHVGPDMGWKGLATRGIRTLDVPGDHHTIMHEPNVASLAQMVAVCMATASAVTDE